MEIAGQAIDRQIEVMHQQQQKGEEFVRIPMNCKKNEGLVLIPKTSTSLLKVKLGISMNSMSELP